MISRTKGRLKVRRDSTSIQDELTDPNSGQRNGSNYSFNSQKHMRISAEPRIISIRTSIPAPKSISRAAFLSKASRSRKDESSLSSFLPTAQKTRKDSGSEWEETWETLGENEFLLRTEGSILELKQLSTTAEILEAQSKLICALVTAIESLEEVNYQVEVVEAKTKLSKTALIPSECKAQGSKVEADASARCDLLWKKHNGQSEPGRTTKRSTKETAQRSSMSLKVKGILTSGEISAIHRHPESLYYLPRLPRSQGGTKGAITGSFSKIKRRNFPPQPIFPKVSLKSYSVSRLQSPISRTSLPAVETAPKLMSLAHSSNPKPKTRSYKLALNISEDMIERLPSKATLSGGDSDRGQQSKDHSKEEKNYPYIEIINNQGENMAQTPQEPVKILEDQKNTNYLSPLGAADKSDRLNPKSLERSSSGYLAVMMQLIDLSRQEILERQSLKNQKSKEANQEERKTRPFMAKDDMEDQNPRKAFNKQERNKIKSLSKVNQKQPSPLNMGFFPLAMRFLKNFNQNRGDMRSSTTFQMSNTMDMFDMESYMNISNLNELEEELIRAHTYYTRQGSNTSMDEFWRQLTTMNRVDSYQGNSMVNRSSQNASKPKKVNFAVDLSDEEAEIEEQIMNHGQSTKERPQQVLVSAGKEGLLDEARSEKVRREGAVHQEQPTEPLGRPTDHPNYRKSEKNDSICSNPRQQSSKQVIKVVPSIAERRHSVALVSSLPHENAAPRERRKELTRATTTVTPKAGNGEGKRQAGVSFVVKDSPRDSQNLAMAEGHNKPPLDQDPTPGQNPKTLETSTQHELNEAANDTLGGSDKKAELVEEPTPQPPTRSQPRERTDVGDRMSEAESSYIRFIDNSNECISPINRMNLKKGGSRKQMKSEDALIVPILSTQNQPVLKEDTSNEEKNQNKSAMSQLFKGKELENRSSTDKEFSNPLLYEKSIDDTIRQSQNTSFLPQNSIKKKPYKSLFHSEKSINYNRFG